jgi:hypothetical protein
MATIARFNFLWLHVNSLMLEITKLFWSLGIVFYLFPLLKNVVNNEQKYISFVNKPEKKLQHIPIKKVEETQAPNCKTVEQQPTTVATAPATTDLLQILPEKVLTSILGEWVESMKDMVAFDTAACNRQFRSCLLNMKNSFFKIESSSLQSIVKCVKWQEPRNLRCKHRVTLPISKQCFFVVEMQSFPVLKESDAL